jgi:radical SAM superfamily enzyme YgiQ (UPF0313 family)
MRILLVKPSHLRAYQPSMVPPLGLMVLASVLRDKGGHDVAMVDTRLYEDPASAIDRALKDFQPDVIGISYITFERDHAALLCRQFRAWRQDVPIILGGPHPSALPVASLEQTGADAAVIGEGEEVLPSLVEALVSRHRPGLQGVVLKGDIHTAGPQTPAPAPDVNLLPLPAWDLVDLDEYARHPSMCILGPWRYAVMSTSRGCPWRCVYCHNLHGKRFRPRSLERVGEELDLLQHRLGRGVVEILDDSFNANPDRAKGILELFCRTDGRLQPAFPNGIRSDLVDSEMLDLMKRSGTRYISFAIESGSPEVQRRIHKNLDLDAARLAIEGASARGLYSNGFFMLGFPGETLGEMLRTIRFSLEVPLRQALFFRVVSLPGSSMRQDHGHDDQDLTGIDDFHFSRTNLSAVSERVLQAVHRMAYVAFYSRPRAFHTLVTVNRRRFRWFLPYFLSGRSGN